MAKNIIIAALIAAFALQCWIINGTFKSMEALDRANTFLYLGNVRLFNFCTKGH